MITWNKASNEDKAILLKYYSHIISDTRNNQTFEWLRVLIEKNLGIEDLPDEIVFYEGQDLIELIKVYDPEFVEVEQQTLGV